MSGTERPVSVNRYSERHQEKVEEQVRRLIRDERAYRDRWAAGLNGEGDCLLLARGVRRPGESDYAVAFCNVYLHMGWRRSLAKALERWQWHYERGLVAKVPTLDTLKSWSRRYEWQARAYLFDHISLADVLLLNIQAQEIREHAQQEIDRRRLLRKLKKRGLLPPKTVGEVIEEET